MADVKKLREKLGLSKREFAEKVGVTVRTVEMWENGKAVPSGSASILLDMLDAKREIISSSAKDNSVSVAAGVGSSVNVGTETERFISAIERQQDIMTRQLDALAKRDEQIDRLISLLEKR